MYNTEMRVAMVVRRVNLLHRKRKHSITIRLSILCLMLMGCLTGAISVWGGQRQVSVRGLYGTTMLFEDAGAYVLVSVIAFAAAVAITMLCIRYGEKGKKKENKMEEEQK